MAKSKAVVKKTAKRVLSPKQEAVKEVLQITWVLDGQLKRARIAYLYVGKLLTDVRDRKLYERLGHASMDDYAQKRLNLRQSSLYRYLRVYEWVLKFHSEWLQPKPKGFIPDFSDVNDLIWIDEELARKSLSAEVKSDLQALQAKGLEGNLKQDELRKWKNRGRRAGDALKSVLSKLRLLCRRSKNVTYMPAEALSYLDAAIKVIENTVAARQSK